MTEHTGNPLGGPLRVSDDDEKSAAAREDRVDPLELRLPSRDRRRGPPEDRPALELLWTLGKPAVVLLDYFRYEVFDALRNRRRLPEQPSGEEREAAELAEQMEKLNDRVRGRRRLLQVGGIDLPDVLAAVAAGDVRAAMRATGGDPDRFPGWTPLLQDYRERRLRFKFKARFQKETGSDPDALLRWLRHQGFQHTPPHGELRRAVASALDFIAQAS